ncbi:hypothetical protein D3C79_49110 [compost metagenome]
MYTLIHLVLTILVLAAAMHGSKVFMLAWATKAKAATKGTRDYYLKWGLVVAAALLMVYIFILFTRIGDVL